MKRKYDNLSFIKIEIASSYDFLYICILIERQIQYEVIMSYEKGYLVSGLPKIAYEFKLDKGTDRFILVIRLVQSPASEYSFILEVSYREDNDKPDVKKWSVTIDDEDTAFKAFATVDEKSSEIAEIVTHHRTYRNRPGIVSQTLFMSADYAANKFLIGISTSSANPTENVDSKLPFKREYKMESKSEIKKKIVVTLDDSYSKDAMLVDVTVFQGDKSMKSWITNYFNGMRARWFFENICTKFEKFEKLNLLKENKEDLFGSIFALDEKDLKS